MSDKVFIPAPNCDTGDNQHSLIDAEEPYFCQCSTCGERFALVSETVLRELDIDIIKRATREM